MRSLRPSVTRT